MNKAESLNTYANFDGKKLTIGNNLIERIWVVNGELLSAVSLSDKSAGKSWQLNPELEPEAADGKVEFLSSEAPLITGSDEGLHVKLVIHKVSGDSTYNFAISENSRFIIQSMEHSEALFPKSANTSGGKSGTALGIELAEMNCDSGLDNAKKICALENWLTTFDNKLVLSAELRDNTDCADNLMKWSEFRAGPKEKFNSSGCLFAVLDPVCKNGLVILKHAPLPHARSIKEETDLEVSGNELSLFGFAGGSYEKSYNWTVIPFGNGRWGITEALQHERMVLHPYVENRDGLCISNTWGDRNRDGALNEAFLLDEVETAAELGLDICQIDDGWQRGTSANSVNAAEEGGVWAGFHAADAEFWSPNKTRLPNGLEPILGRGKNLNTRVGLWFAPDSAEDFANWRKDADTLLGLWRKYGVTHFKADSIKATTKRGEENLQKLFSALCEESGNQLLVDLDVTAGIRPGYFGAPEAGNLFIENRYSDHHNYWPHATFRNVWQLSKILPPSILRMEILNLARNTDKYANDPLAPQVYDSRYVFATIMFSSPLVWCELSNLEDKQKKEMTEIIGTWKKYRHEMHTGTVYPIGDTPDGGSWSGFLSETKNVSHLLVFREINEEDTFSYDLPISLAENKNCEKLFGNGEIAFARKQAQVTQQGNLSFSWWRIEK